MNDMAEVNIDAELVRASMGQAGGHEVQLVQQQLVELTNGCICCTLRDDLLKVTSHVMSALPQQAHYTLDQHMRLLPSGDVTGLDRLGRPVTNCFKQAICRLWQHVISQNC